MSRFRRAAAYGTMLALLVSMFPAMPEPLGAVSVKAIDVSFPSDNRRLFGTGFENLPSVAVGDMNGDSDLDLVMVNVSGQNVVYLNDGAGNFYNGSITCGTTDPSSISCFGTATDSTNSVAVGDMDEDGDLDIIQQNVVYMNDGAGTFPATGVRNFGTGTDSTGRVVVGDVNSDGDLDIIVGNDNQQSVVYLNDGAGNFPMAGARNFGTGTDSISSMVVGDVNSDGDLDIIVGNSNQQNVVYLNDGAGNFPAASKRNFGTGTGLTTSVAVGDMDGDGDLDIVTAIWNQQSVVYLNDGAGNFPVAGARNFGIGQPYSMVVGDVDSDGDLDIIKGDLHQNMVYLNDGVGNFPVVNAFSIGTDASSLVVADIDRDGNLDLVVARHLAQSIIYLNGGAGSFPTASTRSFGAGTDFTSSVAVGDMDGDGDLDIVTGNSAIFDYYGCSCYIGQQSVVYLNDSAGSFPTASTRSFGAGTDFTSSVAVGDMDGDGDLDIVVGKVGQQNMVYLNDGSGSFPAASTRNFGTGTDSTSSVAVGDMDGDGDLDIVTGNSAIYDTGCSCNIGQQNVVYLNNGTGSFPATGARNFGTGTDSTSSIAVGDVDNDNDLDVVTGNSAIYDTGCSCNIGQQSVVYLNDGTGSFPATGARNFGTGTDSTSSVAVGDMNGDGVLDIIVANDNQQNVIYLNDGTGSFPATGAGNFGLGTDLISSMTVGDVDGDGDLDIVTSNFLQQSMVYLNNGVGNFPAASTRSFGTGTDLTTSVAVGDMDGDGDLDIVTGNQASWNGSAYVGGQKALYLNGLAGSALIANNPPMLAITRPGPTRDANFYSTPEIQDTRLISIPYMLEDPEGDPVREVRTEYSLDGGGQWRPAIAATGTTTRSLATAGQSLVLNGSSQAIQSSASVLKVNTALTAEAWIFPISNTGNQVILNREGEYELGRFSDGTIRWALANTNPGWTWQNTGFVAPLNQWTHIALTYSSIIIGSVRIYANGNLVDTYAGSGVIGDADAANNAFRIGFRQAPFDAPFVGRIDDVRIWNVTRTQAQIQDTMHRLLAGSVSGLRGAWRFDDARRSANAPYVWTMPDSSGNAADGTLLGYNAAAAPLANGAPTSAPHTFVWDTFASGVFGQSDNVVVRMEAYPSLSSGPNGTPIFQRPYASATTFPFRLRGSQIRVVDDSGALVPDAVVLRRPNGDTAPATAFTFGSNAFATTDQNGYLRGRGTLGISDTLTVLAPVEIDATKPYSGSATLYHTNIDPHTGLGDFVVSSSGVQTVTVSPSRPLLLFHLDVSLEWDARNDPVYLAQLESDLRRTSEILFDATNGQAALGDINVWQDKENWDTAHIRIHATSRLRPSALVGGVSGDVLTRTLTLDGELRDLISAPGQLQMGATWNRFGNVGDNLAEDWPRTLAHELGHYLFFLDDNYVGVNAQGRLTAVESCPGLMADPYASLELRPAAGWLLDCAQTFSHQVNRRSDWQTIQDTALYNFLQAPSGSFGDPAQNGPFSLPLDVTGIGIVDPITKTVRLDAPYIYARSASGSRIVPSPRASAYLFQDSWRDKETSERDRITALGGATQDFVLARGARVGDRVCLFDPGATLDPLQGCTTITPGNETVTLRTDPSWAPEITVTPVTSLTLELSVALPASYTGPGLRAMLHPAADSFDPITVTLTREPGLPTYRGRVTLDLPLDAATVHVWTDVAEDSPARRDAVSSFSIGGSPGFFRQGGGFFRQGGGFFRQGGGFFRQGGGLARVSSGFFRQGGGFFRQGGGFFRQGGGFFRQGGAPVSSASGDVLIYGEDLAFDPGAYLVLQASDSVPDAPSWATPIGQSYVLQASMDAPDLRTVEISFGYRGREVPVGEEGGIRIYYQAPGLSTWEVLTTTLNIYYNQAAAQLRGPGRYALMSSIEVPLSGPGWNLLAYPVQETRSPSEALASADGAYTIVYGYDQADATDPWQVYAPAPAPSWVSDLAALEFGQGYWIYATRSTTVAFHGASRLQSGAALNPPPAALNPPPATIYGVIAGATADQPVTAVIGETACGQSTTQQVGNAVVFVIKVSAVAPDLPACGAFGRNVAIMLAGKTIASTGWDNTRAININAQTTLIYLPLVTR